MVDHISNYLDKAKSQRLTVTISEVIYNNIKESILKRKLKPNQRIKIREIAEFLGVSQTPVREAIQRLAAEKFLSIEARSEVKVVDLGIEESQKLSELVRILDIACLRKSLREMSSKQIAELKAMTQKLTEYYQKKEIDLYIEQNLKIHKALWKACDNDLIRQTLIEAVERLNIVESTYLSYFTDSEYLKKSWKDHCLLMEAIEARDVKKAEEILFVHWSYR
jgi:DNA-binding GntR family transcriptional regulator